MHPNLDLAKHTKTTLDVNNTLAAAVLENSYGQPTMSDNDVKVAIISLLNTCRTQQEVIDELVDYVNKQRALKTKRKLWNRKK
jgi:hypothetical protein